MTAILHKTPPLRFVGIFVFLLLTTYYLLLTSANAQQSISLNISPTTVEEKVEPGQLLELSLNVENRGDAPAELYPLARNIFSVNEGSQPVYSMDPADNAYELASWISYDAQKLNVNPGERKTLNFKVRVPSDARPGSHLAGVFLSQKPPEGVKQGAAVGVEIASLLILQISGEINEDTQIREFRSGRFIYGSPNVDMFVRIENRGNSISRPRGLVDISDMWGKKMEVVPVNDESAAIFAGSERTFKLDWKPEGFLLGRYEAVLSMAVPLVSGGNQTISSVIQFWVLPLNIVMPVLGGLLAFVLVFVVLTKLYVRRQIAQYRGVRQGARYAQAPAQGISRLTVVVIALLVAIILGLLILFVFLA
jgi:hypothetical protein